MAKIEGGCLCGSVRYSSDEAPKAVINCYCETCRKNSGSTNSYNLAMPAGSVKVKGDTVATYVDRSGASGKPFNRHFCSKCGSHFLSGGPAYEGLEFIKAGTLDSPDAFAPAVHIWCEEKVGWLELPKGSTQLPRNPG
jgi:hypothetical protein